MGIDNIPLHGFKKAAEEAYTKTPLDSKEYAQRVAESTAEELVSIAGLSEKDSATIASEIESALKKVTAQGDDQLAANDTGAFNTTRTGVSEIVGREVLPKIFVKYNLDYSLKNSFGPRDLVHIVGRCMQGETPAEVINQVVALSPQEMRSKLESAGCIKPGEYLYDDFVAMSASNMAPDDVTQKVLTSSILTMNAAWKSIQLGRAVNEQNAKRITTAGNYGTFEEMVRAMYKDGFERSGGKPEVGVIRAVFELAKDLKQIHAI